MASLDTITDFPGLLAWLEEELEWPIDEADFESLTFDYSAAELGLKPEVVGGNVEIKQLRPLVDGQPWGVFFLNLPHRHLPQTIVRNILGRLTVKKRAASNDPSRPAFLKSDLLFITATGAASERRLAFAHFQDDPLGGNSPRLRLIGWDANDTVRRLGLTELTLKERLHWPQNPADADAWRQQWAGAFTRADTRTVVRDSKAMAKELAALARRIRASATELIAAQTETGSLVVLHKAFREALIHDLTPEGFADTFAQTIAYGLLSAAISRASGALTQDNVTDTVAGTSPFLKEMLGQFLEAGGRRGRAGQGLDFDELGVGDVVDLLRKADMEAVLADFDRRNPDEDPVIHFYELFLKEYDAQQKVKRGVFYTPRPVVGFIVRSVDEVLRTEFHLEDGLASTATWGEVIEASRARGDEKPITLPEGAKLSDPFVRILDPATGTGTFLVECVDLIHKTMTAKWKAAGKREAEVKALWNEYVPEHLLPRLTGFELMMAPYAIAHVKLGLKLSDTGYTFGSDARAQIYLTNALLPPRVGELDLADDALTHEANAANAAKLWRYTVVIGNPPYAGHSSNPSKVHLRGKGRGKGKKVLTWIGELIQPYFSVDGQPLGEKNPKWVNNDYVKFLRLAETRILASGTGVLGYITSNSWLDSPTFRGVRASILATFPRLWIVDCHGNIKKKEKAPDGSKDEGIFEIEEGTGITVGTHGRSAGVFHYDLLGTFDSKKAWLAGATALKVAKQVEVRPPSRLLARMGDADAGYPAWAPLPAILPVNSVGIVSARDDLVFGFTEAEATDQARRFAGMAAEEAREAFDLGKDAQDWTVELAQRDAQKALSNGATAVPILYRPFDTRYGLYTGNSRGFMCRPRPEVMRHLVAADVAALVTTRQRRRVEGDWPNVTVSMAPIESTSVSAGTSEIGTAFPLWLKPQGTETCTLPNIAPAFSNRVAALTGLAYDDCVEGPKQGALAGVAPPRPSQTALFPTRRERGEPGKSFGPRDLFDWIYAVLHSPAYRQRYADYLKSDFARIPLPHSRALFEALIPLGTELVALHLLDEKTLPELTDPKGLRLAGSGEPRVTAKMPQFENGRVYINRTRWFETVPEVAWAFHIGGYQPAQKWLKDRAAKGGKKASPGRVLTQEDILHYRRIILALTRTAELMPKIDELIEAHGGWPGAFRGMTDND